MKHRKDAKMEKTAQLANLTREVEEKVKSAQKQSKIEGSTK
jgi:TPP-dependent pyruvate/acetoin dehydrogenase alpha subunit